MASSMEVRVLQMGDLSLRDYILNYLDLENNNSDDDQDQITEWCTTFWDDMTCDIFDFDTFACSVYETQGTLHEEFEDLLREIGLLKYPGILEVRIEGDDFLQCNEFNGKVTIYNNITKEKKSVYSWNECNYTRLSQREVILDYNENSIKSIINAMEINPFDLDYEDILGEVSKEDGKKILLAFFDIVTEDSGEMDLSNIIAGKLEDTEFFESDDFWSLYDEYKETIYQEFGDFSQEDFLNSEKMINDKEFILRALRKFKDGREILKSIPEQFLSDSDVWLTAIRKDLTLIDIVPLDIKNSSDFKEEVEKIFKTYKKLPQDYIDFFKTIIRLSNDVPYIMDEVLSKYAPLEDKEFIKLLILNSDDYKKFVTPEIRKEIELIDNDYYKFGIDLNSQEKEYLRLVNLDIKNFLKIPLEFRDSENFMTLAIGQNNDAAGLLSSRLKNDKKFINFQLANNRHSIFKFISPELKDDIEFLKSLVIKLGNADFFEFISERAKNDLSLMKVARQYDTDSISRYASNQIRNNKEFFLESIANFQELSLQYAGSKIKYDKECLLKIINLNHFEIQYMPEEFFEDFEFITDLLWTTKGRIFEYLPTKYKLNKDVVLRAMKLNGDNLEYLHGKLAEDPEVVRAALLNYPQSIEYATDSFRDSLELALEIIDNDANCFKYFSFNVRSNPELIKKAVKNSYYNFIYVPVECITPEIVNTALLDLDFGDFPLTYLPTELQNDPKILELFSSSYED